MAKARKKLPFSEADLAGYRPRLWFQSCCGVDQKFWLLQLAPPAKDLWGLYGPWELVNPHTVQPTVNKQQDISLVVTRGVFLSVNPKTDFRSKNGFRVPFGKSKSGFLICWILFEKGFIRFEIRRIQIQINGLVIYAVPFTVDPNLFRWSSGISSWSIPIEAVEFPRCCHLPQNIWKH